MKIRELIRQLVEERGAIVRTEHHLQIPLGGTTGRGKQPFHDIWIGKVGLKWKLAGCHRVHSGPPECLLRDVAAHSADATDLAWMQRLTAFLRRVDGRVGVFVDAGWKSGKAKAALIRLKAGGDADILIRCFKSASSHEAETKAVKMAMEEWNEQVYTDSQHAAEKTGAAWIPREQNREADALGNMRR